MIVLPMFSALTPFFCKYICPSGTIAGILLALRNEGIRPLLVAIHMEVHRIAGDYSAVRGHLEAVLQMPVPSWRNLRLFQ